MSDLFDAISKIAQRYTPEYLKELAKRAYDDDRNYLENFSNWYPYIIDFGHFKHSEIISNQIFTFEEVEIMRETDNIDKVNWDKINEIITPTLNKMQDYKLYNIKNGCFSNKFDFNTCLATKKNLAKQLWKINYQSSMFETGGYTELVVREIIPYNKKETPTIYNGMPLRTEVRVFYNMDTKQIEYIVDYWDYNYCYESISGNKTDSIIFDWFHNNTMHKSKFNMITEYIYKNISTLKFNSRLKGIWSIDFMYVDNTIEDDLYIYLIDMARGERSAYWDPNKLMR